MIQRQVRNRQFACLNSEMVGGFPPYVINGKPVPQFSMCEVMDDDTRRVVALYKLVMGQWYRYDLVAVWPPYPPQPQPLVQTISLGLVVPGMPLIFEPVSNVVSVTPVYIARPALAVPNMPTITEEVAL